MKKRLLSAFLCFILAFTLLPVTAFAAAPTRLKSVDIVFDLPKAGEPREMETEVNVKSIKSGNIDLLANGATIMYTEWQGDDVVTDDDEYLFRAGTTYLVNVKLAFDTTKGYCANYKTLGTGENIVGPDTFSATVNGVRATVYTSAQYFPTLQVSLTIAGERFTEDEKNEMNNQQAADASALAKSRRAMYPSITQAEADANDQDKSITNVVVMNGAEIGKGYEYGHNDAMAHGYNMAYLADTKFRTLIMDVDDSAFENKSCAEEFPYNLVYNAGLTDIWLSPKVNVADFVGRMDEQLRSPLDHSYRFLSRSDKPFFTAKGTLYIPESAVPALKAELEKSTSIYKMAYTIKTYSGSDVYAAQKAGAAATKDWHTNHSYTKQIQAADRVYTHATCQTSLLYYYSCATCGKCEYNPKHVARDIHEAETIRMSDKMHSEYMAELPNDSAYIGVNAAGQHIYWLSCDQCGKSYRYVNQHLTQRDVAVTGTGMGLAEYQAVVNSQIKMRETLALSSTEVQPDMFAIRSRSTVKADAWAQSDINLALNDNLLDAAVLGNDYTKSITRLQFCSVAVRLAETLTGKSLPAAASGTFTDTTSPYVLKAYAAGITTGTGTNTFEPNGTLTRQQMAAFLYRTLRYVEKNSDYRYTSYTSKLASFKDNAQVQSWAREAMAFMNALDLITGTTATTLTPSGKCTIEQAVAVAERSVYAHLIGWYQVTTDNTGFKGLPAEGTDVYTTLREGEIVWVTGRRLGVYNQFTAEDENLPYTFVPAIDPYTGQMEYLFNRDVRPIRG